jgi:hypothetical protein
MISTDPERLFTNLPKQVSFPLNTDEQFSHGLFWFADKGGNIPDAEDIWRDSFGATEEEIAFSNNRAKTRRFLLKQKLFGSSLPFAA